MKRALYLIAAIAFIVSSCDPLADIYDEMEQTDTGYSNNVEYTLTSDDYSTIGSLAANPDDGAFISSNMYFNDQVTASANVPPFLAQKFPALSIGSSALVTYNYSGDLPDNLVDYTTFDTYNLDDGDYESFDGVLQVAKYYSPGYAPEIYIPDVLAAQVSGAYSGDLVLAGYDYSDVDPQVDFNGSTNVGFETEDFETSLGTYSDTSVVGAQSWYATSYSGTTYAKMSGYSSGAQPNEDWLISPGVDLSGRTDAYLSFRHAANYVNGQWDFLKVFISTDYAGDIGTASWTELTVPTWPAGNNWTFVESGYIDLASYLGQTVNVAFKYTSDASTAATWEIDWVEFSSLDIPVVGKDPVWTKTLFEFDGSDWAKAEGVYYLNGVDYNAMGSPGKYDNFSASDPPQEYLPNFLSSMYPLAGQDFETVVVYKYYAGGGVTLTLADKYVYNEGAWESTWNYVDPRTSQFLNTADGWVFDPTVIFSMKSEDYQMIVDWVDANIGSQYIDTYGTAESYSGAGSYYSNFDLRPGKWDDAVFSTWQDAVEAAIGVALLPTKFPNAVAQVSGIDVLYKVSFATYDGNDGSYTWTFQCTKSGPDPEFTLVE